MTSSSIDQAIDTASVHPAVRGIVITPRPEILVRLQKVMASADPDLSEIESLASADVALAAALIRRANSPFYSRGQSVATVGRALAVIGLRPSIDLLSAFSVREAFNVRSPLLDHFWESSQRKAIACEHIGRQLYSFDAGLGYSFGLFCHVGIPVLVKAIKGYEETVTEAIASEDRTFTQTENERHKTDHAVMGAIVARTWNLPADVTQAIWLHHDFSCLSDERFAPTVRHLVALGLLADFLVGQFEELPPSREWIAHGEDCLAHLSVTQEELEHWADALHKAFDAVQF